MPNKDINSSIEAREVGSSNHERSGTGFRVEHDNSLSGETETVESLQQKLQHAVLQKKALDEAMKALDETMKAKDEAIKAQDETMKAKDEAIKAQDEAIKAQDEAIKAMDRIARARGVVAMLKDTPKMEVNPDCIVPSIMDNNEAQATVQKYRKDLKAWKQKLSIETDEEKRKKLMEEKPERFQFHEPAQILTGMVSPLQYMDFDLVVDDNQGCPIPSSLYLKLRNSWTLDHHNRTSPETYLQEVFSDIIRCYGLNARVVMEATLFSLRPDLLVVYFEGCVLFLVEVKNPSIKGKLVVFESETAAGQTFKYCSLQKQCGIDHPFVLLSTYNESAIVRLGGDEKAYNDILSKACTHLQNGSIDGREGMIRGGRNMPPSSPMNDDRKQGTAKKTPPSIISPMEPHLGMLTLASLKRASTSHDKTGVDDDDDDDNFDEMKVGDSVYDYEGRVVVFSETVGVEKLYKTVALLLASSIIVAPNASRTESITAALVPKEGSDLGGKDYFTLYEDGHCFQKIQPGKKANYNTPPNFKAGEKFHVLSELGRGRTERYILCCSSTGKMFVAKLFLLDASTAYSAEDIKQEMEKDFSAKRQSAEAECKRWKHHEPDLQKYFNVLTMNGIPAFSMPFFPAVPLKRREEALPIIEECLKNLADEGNGFVYSEIRWRHFGCRFLEDDKMDITPLNLGSLVEAQLATFSAVIKSHIKELTNLKWEEKISPPMPPFAK